MKNILVLIDNAVNSEHLALSAMNIALAIGSTVTLAHATKKYSDQEDDFENEITLQNAREWMAILEGKLKHIANGKSTITCLLHVGTVIDLLAQQTNDGLNDLVVIGAHQSGEWGKVMFRTQMQAILENIGCTLLVVPKKYVVNQIKKIVFAVDLSVGYKNALRYVVAFSAHFNAQVVVNHISKLGFPEKPSEEDICNAVNLNLDKNFSPVTFHTLKSTNVKTALLQTIAAGNLDLLCLVHKNYDFFSGIFHRSMSKQLANKSLIPIMILSESY